MPCDVLFENQSVSDCHFAYVGGQKYGINGKRRD